MTEAMAEFLEARVIDDERAMAANVTGGDSASMRRYLAECEAKREIISEAVTAAATERSAAECAGFDGNGFDTAGDAILRSLCRVYADHPDCDERWRE